MRNSQSRKKPEDRKYEYRDGHHVSGLPAHVVGTELERIAELSDGQLTPDAVVNESRPEYAALHPAFEWDDEAAAEMYRKDQARHIVRSVRVVRAESPTPHQAWVHVRVTTEKGRTEHAYERMEHVVTNPVMLVAVLDKYQRDAASLQATLEDIRRLSGESGDGKLAIIALAAEALATAREAVARLN